MERAPEYKVLVVDDEPSIREVLTDFLMLEGYDVIALSDGQQAIARLERERFDAALIDLKMPGINGLEVLAKAKSLNPSPIVVMMTGYGTVESAIEAMKAGAYDYILKPFKVQEVIRLLQHAVAQQRLEHENIQLKQALSLYEYSERMSRATSLEPIFDLLIEVARQELTPDVVSVWVKTPPLASGALEGAESSAFRCVRRWNRGDLDFEPLQLAQRVRLELLAQLEQRGEPLVLSGAQALEVVGRPQTVAVGSLSLLAIPLKNKGELEGFLTAFVFDDARVFVEGGRKMLAVLCGRASAALESAALYGELEQTFKQTIQAFANLLEDKDPYTKGHSDRVSRYARLIAAGMGLPREDVERIADSALLHDIGKMGLRYEDLNKVEPLTEAEYEMFKSHTTRGKWMLEPISFLHHLIPGVYHHHERWDGRGYPLGLAGEEIPLDARILAIADTYDAMTSHRAYRRALPHDVAIREIKAFAGAQFDPALVEVFVREISQDRQGYASKAQRWQALLDYRPSAAGQ